MIILMIVVAILLVTMGYAGRIFQTNRILANAKKPDAIEVKKNSELGRVGKELTALFNSIPEAHRPNMNIYDVCRALDVKYGTGNLMSHFYKESYDDWDYTTSYYFRGWKNHGCEGECLYPEYVELALQMKELIASVQEQERVLELAAHQSGLSEAKMLMAALDDSVHVVRSVTQEVSDRVESYS